MEKYYKILEVHTNASEPEVKQAYRDLVKVWHPDRFTHDIKLQKRAEEKLKEINDAYQRIVDHLNNVHKRQQSQQYQRTEKQEKSASQPPPKQSYNSWICPKCLRTNYFSNLSCSCGFRTNEIEVKTYKADLSSADLYDAILFNRSMDYTDRANFLARYLLIRFPNSKEADFIKNGSQSATPPRQQTKPNKLRHFKKNWGWYLVLGLIALAIINSALNPEPSKKQPAIPKPPTQIAEPIFTQPVQPLPINGKIKRYVTDEAIAPLKIVTRESGYHYFVKIVDWYTNKLICTVFIRSGQSVTLDLPLGSYKLKYAAGSQWYGTKFLFGPETAYSVADKRFYFGVSGDHVSGYTVELYLQPHGNLKTNRISAEEF